MMKEKAIEKINKEMEGESAYVKYIGEYLKKELEVRDIAEYILDEEKSISDSLKVMTKVAEEKSNGEKVAVMTDEEGIKIIEEYFGISNIKRLEIIKGKVINLSLDDLLGVE